MNYVFLGFILRDQGITIIFLSSLFLLKNLLMPGCEAKQNFLVSWSTYLWRGEWSLWIQSQWGQTFAMLEFCLQAHVQYLTTNSARSPGIRFTQQHPSYWLLVLPKLKISFPTEMFHPREHDHLASVLTYTFLRTQLMGFHDQTLLDSVSLCCAGGVKVGLDLKKETVKMMLCSSVLEEHSAHTCPEEQGFTSRQSGTQLLLSCWANAFGLKWSPSIGEGCFFFVHGWSSISDHSLGSLFT